MNRNEVLDFFASRATCKKYDPTKKISTEDLHVILEAGRLAPSSFGFEPWRFLVIENEELRLFIREHAWGIKDKMDCSHVVVYLARHPAAMHPDSEYLQNLMANTHHITADKIPLRRETFRNFLQNDMGILDNTRAMFDWAAKQTYLAMLQMMYAAHALNIDSTPVEGFNYDFFDKELSAHGLYDLNEFNIAAMCAFGYRLKDGRPKTRQSFSEVVKFID